MAIVNVTPDSFSDGGIFFDGGQLQLARVIDRAARLIADGADLLDIGGESTRPGATPVSVTEELSRVVPVIEALAARFAVPLSVDTSEPRVMRAAVVAGATLINDVRALSRPYALATAAELVREAGVFVCLMHSRGEPGSMDELARYASVVTEVRDELMSRVQAAQSAGIDPKQIVLDPGFGFAKNSAQNYTLFRGLSQLAALGFPLLVGVSRKRMIGELLNLPVAAERVLGSAVLAALAVERGARIVRVHDVRETAQALRLFAAIEPF
ncbi:dihydropteroate synthase [Halothiobacillus sp. DCM-1]